MYYNIKAPSSARATPARGLLAFGGLCKSGIRNRANTPRCPVFLMEIRPTLLADSHAHQNTEAAR